MIEDHSLLELQRVDSAADALRVRRAGLSERAELQACEAELEALGREREEAAPRRVALAREERRVEAEVADLTARAREVERTLYSGTVTAIRELEALQAELRDFDRRRREREEEELVVMEQEEQLGGRIAVLDARRAELAARAAELRKAIGAAEAEIDAELARVAEERSAVAAQLAAPLLGTYQQLRGVARLAGRAAVRMERGTCTGCRVVLPIVLATRIQHGPADGSTLCPSCGRLLVP
jgi:hypothetical protein